MENSNVTENLADLRFRPLQPPVDRKHVLVDDPDAWCPCSHSHDLRRARRHRLVLGNVPLDEVVSPPERVSRHRNRRVPRYRPTFSALLLPLCGITDAATGSGRARSGGPGDDPASSTIRDGSGAPRPVARCCGLACHARTCPMRQPRRNRRALRGLRHCGTTGAFDRDHPKGRERRA